MKKLLFLFLLISVTSLFAQDKLTIIDINENEIYTCEEGTKLEYIFDGFVPLSVPNPDGLDANSRKWGIYNLQNSKMSVPFNADYGYIGIVIQGKVVVMKENKFGMIEASTGRVIVPFEYTKMTSVMDGDFWVGNKSKGFCVFDENGKKVFCKDNGEFNKDWQGVLRYGRQGDVERSWGGYKIIGSYLMVNMEGKDLLPIDHKYKLLYDPFLEGLKKVEKDGQVGFINIEGKEVIPCRYKSATNFKNGIARVSTEKDKYEYINADGKVIIPSSAGAFNHRKDNYIVYEKNNKFGLLDTNGNIFMEANYPTFESIAIFQNGYSYTKDVENNVSVINAQGEVVMPLGQGIKFKKIKNDILLYEMDNKKGLLHVSGDEILAPEYENITAMEEDENWIVKQNGKYGIVSPKGKIILEIEYDKIKFECSAGKFNDDPGDITYVLVKGDLQGIYYQGKIIEPKFKKVGTANEGFIPVVK